MFRQFSALRPIVIQCIRREGGAPKLVASPMYMVPRVHSQFSPNQQAARSLRLNGAPNPSTRPMRTHLRSEDWLIAADESHRVLQNFGLCSRILDIFWNNLHFFWKILDFHATLRTGYIVLSTYWHRMRHSMHLLFCETASVPEPASAHTRRHGVVERAAQISATRVGWGGGARWLDECPCATTVLGQWKPAMLHELSFVADMFAALRKFCLIFSCQLNGLWIVIHCFAENCALLLLKQHFA